MKSSSLVSSHENGGERQVNMNELNHLLKDKSGNDSLADGDSESESSSGSDKPLEQNHFYKKSETMAEDASPVSDVFSPTSPSSKPLTGFGSAMNGIKLHKAVTIADEGKLN